MTDQPAVLDVATHAQVAALLGTDRARSLLLILRSLLVKLAGASETTLLERDGLSAIHRLKSEAGLMGFIRLSEACAVFDADAGNHGIASAIPNLRAAISSTLLVINELVGPGEDTHSRS